ncbi:hypothetical protein GSI_12653 [Ganoderma sinense ZZ0214-1]|uniref:BTB domain-containing protein n=1 Tax=Ganoderma sinense ZZ0214-1 TaxID=1077348 RepID=A0A2G8RTC1_9APHY|nr:hypothetical protein GSI_12653 [Ganoderma sinense ZZ0214-1]
MWQLLQIFLIVLSFLQSFSPLIGKAGGLFQILELPLAHSDDVSQQSDISAASSRDGTDTSASSERGDEPEDAPLDSNLQETKSNTATGDSNSPLEAVTAAPRSELEALPAEQDHPIGSERVAASVGSDDDTAPDTSATAELKRDEELWFEDGNLILIASEVEFRVYKGPLIAQSLVFKDMLSLPQPSSSDTRSNQDTDTARPSTSCATVHLQDDSLSDLRHFLRMFTGHTVSYVTSAVVSKCLHVMRCPAADHILSV